MGAWIRRAKLRLNPHIHMYTHPKSSKTIIELLNLECLQKSMKSSAVAGFLTTGVHTNSRQSTSISTMTSKNELPGLLTRSIFSGRGNDAVLFKGASTE